MLTQNTEYLGPVNFGSLCRNVNSPSRRISVDSFSLDRTQDGRLILHAWAVFIQVIISTKRSDTIAIALVRIGTVPVLLVNPSLSQISQDMKNLQL